jgi:hypothetical protein
MFETGNLSALSCVTHLDINDGYVISMREASHAKIVVMALRTRNW